MQKNVLNVVVIGTGGTIAGSAATADDAVGYRAAQIRVDELVAGVPLPPDVKVTVEQLAQVDSKDMDVDLWRRLASRVAHHLARSDVAGVVVTHGTDTLEETAYFLQRVLAPSKPVVMAAAMRPASARLSDGPQNLLDAITLAASTSAQGVVAVLAGQIHGGGDVRKRHPYWLDAFDSGDAGAIGQIEEGALRLHRPWPTGVATGLQRLPADAAAWPWVEIVTSHAGARADGVRALCAAGVDGLVVAGTGNGTVHGALESALIDALAGGVMVWRCTRCLDGAVIDPPQGSPLPSAGALTPVQARIELLLQILARRRA